MNLVRFGRYFNQEDPVHSMLAGIPLFRSLGSKDLESVAGVLEHRTVGKGDLVFQQDQPGVGLFIVLSGEVDILRDDEDGTQSRVGRVSAGDCFGELSLLDESPLSANAVATDATDVAIFHRSDLLALAGRDPSLGVSIMMNLSQVVADRLRRTNRALRETREEVEAAELAAREAEAAEAAARGIAPMEAPPADSGLLRDPTETTRRESSP